MFECLEKCQLNDLCVSVSFGHLRAFENCFLFNNSSESTIRSDWSTFIEVKQETTILSTVEYTSFKEKYSANVMASSICYDIYNNKSIDKILFTLDKYLYDTNGWSIITLSKLARLSSTWQLNTIQNLFLFATCSFGDLNLFKMQSFILFYSPEGNCVENTILEKMLITNENNLMTSKKKKEYESIINLLSNELFDSPFFEFKKLKIHRTTNINESTLMNFLIENIKKVIDKSNITVLNVLVNPIDHVDQISVVSKSNTYLRVQISEYDVILFHTSYTKCINLELELELE